MSHHLFFALAELIPWLVWVFYWLWMWQKVKPVAKQEPYPYQWLHRILIICSMVLLGWRRMAIGFLGYPLIPRNDAKGITGLVLTIIGIAIAIWARNILGENWSAQPTVKKDHTLVITGPYKIVRHPIYTGILIAVLGTAIMVGQVRGFIALLLTFFALWKKSQHEEQLMREEFPGQYDEYAKRVKGLIPGMF